MRHKFSFVATFWWVLILFMLGVLLVVFAPKNARESETENRMLQGFPETNVSTVFSGKFMSEFETFLSDGFFARDSLVSLSEDLMGKFSTISAEEILTADIGGEIENEFDARDEQEPAAAPVETAAPAPDTTPSPTWSEQEPASEPSAEATPKPAYTPLKEYEFYMKTVEGGKKHVYSYTPESIEKLMEGLNGFRAVLPEDGTVHFALVPVAQSANWWTRNTDKYCGWDSNAEEYMDALADEGVYIYDGPELLEPGLASGEYLYYRTDHHWTPRGAYKVFAAMMEKQGLPVTKFEDYELSVNPGYLGSIYTENPTAALKAMADDIEVPHALAPVHSYIVKHLTDMKEIDYMVYDRANYLAYVNGTQTPWRRIVTGFHTGRVCLLVSDSFGNCFAPFLVPYYDEVHMVDLRKGNFTQEEAGALVGEYMERYGVDDVYVVLCTASGLNYNYTQEYLTKYLK